MNPTVHTEATLSSVAADLRDLRDLVSRQLEALAERYVSIKRAAEITGLSEGTIRRAVVVGDLPASNVCTKSDAGHAIYRIGLADLHAWMEGLKTRSGGVPPRSSLRDLIDQHLPGLGRRGTKRVS